MAEEALSDINVTIDDPSNAVRFDPSTGVAETDQEDGGVVVTFGRPQPEEGIDEDDFYRNLAEEMDDGTLTGIANELLEGIRVDDESRSEYLKNRERGIEFLGLKIEPPRSAAGDSTSGAVGISSVTNPLMLEAILKGWANALGELLPAKGPMKIRDDGNVDQSSDEMAQQLEKDMNHYLTTGAPEYYPDTSQMILWGVHFAGCGFKKIYRCPLRKRPVSISVDAKDLIVSNTMKDLSSCSRITHVIPMPPDVMKRMMFEGAYRDIPLTQPVSTPNTVDTKIAGVQGTVATQKRPEDQPYNLYETQCVLDLDDFAPKEYKDSGVPLPYLVTIDKDTQRVLSIRRDWDEDDDQCARRTLYVQYVYVPGPGFYGTGLLNILGNCTAAMTAAWREALDAGMFASFPGGLIAKLSGRQNTSVLRMAPGEFAPVETGGLPITQAVMGMPYKDVTAGLLNMMDKIIGQAKSVGGAAEMPTGEGIANVPVGTIMSMIEQATLVIAAAHKGMHMSQAQEFNLLVKLFRENPEDFWRNNDECPEGYWDQDKFLQALDNCKLVPCSDPNVPSHIHRLSKATALAQLILMPPFTPLLDAQETLRRILAAIREDPKGLMPEAPPPPQGPSLMEQAQMIAAQARKEGNQVKAIGDQAKQNVAMANTLSKERTAAAQNATKKDVATLQVVAKSLDGSKDRAQKGNESAQKRAMDIGARVEQANREQVKVDQAQQKIDLQDAQATAKAGADLLKIQNSDKAQE